MKGDGCCPLARGRRRSVASSAGLLLLSIVSGGCSLHLPGDGKAAAGGSVGLGMGGTSTLGGGGGVAGEAMGGNVGAGAGGAAGVAGTSGAGGASGSRRLAIVSSDGYVSKDTNDVGIQGAWYAFAAGASAAVTPNDFRNGGPSICVSGSVGYNAPSYSYVELALSIADGSAPAFYPVVPDGIIGFTFALTGSLVLPDLLVAFKDHCVVFHPSSGVPMTALFTDATASCAPSGKPGDLPFPPATSSIDTVELRVMSSLPLAPFDFCVTNLSAAVAKN
jgi:hypothetical protein